MELKDLIEKPASECTDEELEKRAHLLSKLRVVSEKPKTSSTKGSNKDKRLNDLLKSLTKEQIAKLLLKMGEKS